jgi:hypothetical protein
MLSLRQAKGSYTERLRGLVTRAAHQIHLLGSSPLETCGHRTSPSLCWKKEIFPCAHGGVTRVFGWGLAGAELIRLTTSGRYGDWQTRMLSLRSRLRGISSAGRLINKDGSAGRDDQGIISPEAYGSPHTRTTLPELLLEPISSLTLIG